MEKFLTFLGFALFLGCFPPFNSCFLVLCICKINWHFRSLQACFPFALFTQLLHVRQSLEIKQGPQIPHRCNRFLSLREILLVFKVLLWITIVYSPRILRTKRMLNLHVQRFVSFLLRKCDPYSIYLCTQIEFKHACCYTFFFL